MLYASETYLNSSIYSDDGNMELTGYNSVHADNPTGTKRGVVCICYHNYLFLKVLDVQPLNGCINIEIKIGCKMCSFLCLYRSHSQSSYISETFAYNIQLS